MANSYDRRINLYINGKEVKNDLASIQKAIYQATNELRRMTIGSDEYNKKATELRRIKTIYAEHNAQLRATTSIWSKFGALLPLASGAAIIGTLQSLGSSIINVRSQFEKYEAILTNSLGSQKAARSEMQMLQQFASKTPFSLQELTGSFVKLTNYGLKPSREEMQTYGDLASSVGKGMDQLAEAVADAVTGEFERLKEFGIKARKEGDKISFTFKEQTTVIDNNAQSIKNYLVSLGQLQGVAGSMEAISKTVGGQISNMGDAWDNMLNKMGERTGGAMAFIIDTITGSLNKVSKSFAVLESDELSWFEKWMGSTVATDKYYNEMIKRRENNRAKAEADAIAASDIKNLFGVSTADDINPKFVTSPAAKVKSVGESAAENKAKNDRLKKEEEARKKHFENLKEAIDNAAVVEENALKQQYLDKKLTQEQLNMEMYVLEASHLVAMKALHEQYGLDTADIDAKILDNKIKAFEDSNKKFDDMMKVSAEVEKNQAEEDAKAQMDISKEMEEFRQKDNERRDKEFQDELERKEEQRKAAEKLKDAQVENAVQAGIAAIENAETMEEAGKAILNSIRDQIKAYLAEAVTIAALKALKSVPFPFNIIAASVAGGAAMLLFNKLIPKFETGGYTDGARMYVAGEAGTEWIAPNSMVKDPVIGPHIAVLEALRKGKSVSYPSQDAIQTFKAGGYTSFGPVGSKVDPERLDRLFNKVFNRHMDYEQNVILKQLAEEIQELRKWRPAVSVETFEIKKRQYDEIKNTRGL